MIQGRHLEYWQGRVFFLTDTTLLTKDDFYSKLTKQLIFDEDFNHATTVTYI